MKAFIRGRRYRRYQQIANAIHPWHQDCHHQERVVAENAAALAWRLHHPIRYKLARVRYAITRRFQRED